MIQTTGKKSRKRGCGTRDENRLWCNKDPCGMITAGIVWTVGLYCDYVFSTQLIYPWMGASVGGVFAILLFQYLTIMTLSCHLRTMLSNPGAVPYNAKPVDPAHWNRVCNRCSAFKPPRAHHCSVCKRCIIKMDHHCPWVNNCIGLANQKYFILFLAGVFSMSAVELVYMIMRFVDCMSPTSTCNTTPHGAIMVLSITIVACLFSLFAGCLFADQMTVIATNQTQIDRMKSRTGHASDGAGGTGGTEDTYGLLSSEVNETRRIWSNLEEIFGGNPQKEGIRWHWFFPTPIKYNNPEKLTGYCFRDIPRPRTVEEMEMV